VNDPQRQSKDQDEVMARRDERIAENEALFRLVNERVADIVAEISDVASSLDVFCECGDGGCMEKMTVPRSAYESVRSNSRRFIVATDHVAPEIEIVVEERDSFQVVEKVAAEAAEVAEETDPRGDEAS
jgi:hypothetical protein